MLSGILKTVASYHLLLCVDRVHDAKLAAGSDGTFSKTNYYLFTLAI